MPSEEQNLVDYIRKCWRAGLSSERIKKQLQQKGWHDVQINRAFYFASLLGEGKPKNFPDFEKINTYGKKNRSFRNLILFCFPIFILIALYLLLSRSQFVLAFFNNPTLLPIFIFLWLYFGKDYSVFGPNYSIETIINNIPLKIACILFYFFIIYLVILYSRRRTNVMAAFRVFYRLPLCYLFITMPVIILWLALLKLEDFSCGLKCLFARQEIIGGLASYLSSFLIPLLLSIFLYLWYDQKRRYLIALASLSILGLLFINYQIIIGFFTCKPTDAVCYAQKAHKKEDPMICKKTIKEQECFKELAKIEKNGEICLQIKENNEVQMDCFVGLAIEIDNLKFCDLSSSQFECYKMAAEKKNELTRDLRYCKHLVQDQEKKYKCLAEAAKKEGNIELCRDEMLNSEEKNYCYVNYAFLEKDESLCSRTYCLTNACYKDDCIIQIAKFKQEDPDYQGLNIILKDSSPSPLNYKTDTKHVVRWTNAGSFSRNIKIEKEYVDINLKPGESLDYIFIENGSYLFKSSASPVKTDKSTEIKGEISVQ